VRLAASFFSPSTLLQIFVSSNGPSGGVFFFKKVV